MPENRESTARAFFGSNRDWRVTQTAFHFFPFCLIPRYTCTSFRNNPFVTSNLPFPLTTEGFVPRAGCIDFHKNLHACTYSRLKHVPLIVSVSGSTFRCVFRSERDPLLMRSPVNNETLFPSLTRCLALYVNKSRVTPFVAFTRSPIGIVSRLNSKSRLL